MDVGSNLRCKISVNKLTLVVGANLWWWPNMNVKDTVLLTGDGALAIGDDSWKKKSILFKLEAYK
jgi:hypothetical protein